MDGDRLAMIGGGNMGAALIGGLIAAGWTADRLAIVEVSDQRRDALATMFPGVGIAGECPPCEAAVIAVKPHDVPDAARAAAAAGARRLLSVAAGISIAALEDAATGDVAVIRAMPNTPALVGKGAAAIAGGRFATADDIAWAESILGSVGMVVRVAEDQLDAVTGLTGSGPAYLFLVAEALMDAGVLAGLTRPTAEALVRQLFVGAAAMLDNGDEPSRLRAAVTSPAGTTAAGVRALEEHAVRAAFLDAVQAATMRSRELGRPH